MAIGSAIVLFVIGAILAFAVEVDIAGFDIQTVGYIMMIAGAVGGLLGLLLSFGRRRSRTTQTTQEVHRTADGGQVVETEVRR